MDTVSDAGIGSILKELAKSGSHRGWISDEFVGRITPAVAAAAGLSTGATATRSTLERALSDAATQRALVIVVGRRFSGKSTLVWRLREPKAATMKDCKSTNGLFFGTWRLQ